MKKFFCLFLILFSQVLRADDCLQAAMDEMNGIHKSEYCHDDPIFECVSSSMMAWGVGLTVGIALLTGFVYQSKPKNTTSSTGSTTPPVTPIAPPLTPVTPPLTPITPPLTPIQ